MVSDAKQSALIKMGMGMGGFKTGLEEYIAACTDPEAVLMLQEVQMSVTAAETRLIEILKRADLKEAPRNVR